MTQTRRNEAIPWISTISRCAQKGAWTPWEQGNRVVTCCMGIETGPDEHMVRRRGKVQEYRVYMIQHDEFTRALRILPRAGHCHDGTRRTPYAKYNAIRFKWD